MNKVPHVDPMLKLYGIDQLIAVLKKDKIKQKQILAWTRKHIRSSIIQSDIDFNLSFARKQLKRDLNDSNISNERTLLISDVPKIISSLKGRKLAMILGIKDEEQEGRLLYESGADVVINSLRDIEIIQGNSSHITFTQNLPSAFYTFSNFQGLLNNQKPLFFFDYDGTLAPINRDPASAHLPEETRKLLAQLAGRFRVAIVSGRDMDDLKEFIGLDSLIYAGSHGFRISGPGETAMVHDKVNELLPKLDTLEESLLNDPELKIRGLEFERKYMAIAVHYRNAPPGTYKSIYQSIRRILNSFDEFTTGRGKKVIEIRPALKWHKGKALDYIMHTLEKADNQSYLPIYLGDGITDEDAFRSLPNHGIGILVGKHSAPSAASCHLPDVWEVQKLLHYLVHSAQNQK